MKLLLAAGRVGRVGFAFASLRRDLPCAPRSAPAPERGRSLARSAHSRSETFERFAGGLGVHALRAGTARAPSGAVLSCAPLSAPFGGQQTLARSGLPRPTSPKSAFTLVEIALSLAIIGFALVAIIGVLPTGLKVQRENREETIIVHEANYFLDAIRNGARGLNDLTNSIIRIRNDWTTYNTNNTPWSKVASDYDEYTKTSFKVTSSASPTEFMLTNGLRIIGLLGRPKFEDVGAPNIRSNHVVAYLHALSGAASEKFPVDNPTVLDLAFNYRMIVEVHAVPLADTNTAFARELSPNLKELRLIFRWPLRADGTTGDGRQVFRTITGGQLVRTNDVTEPQQPLFFFEPTTFVNLKAP